MENTVFRIVQECVNNACRHSKSKKVKIELTRQGDELRVEVRDWGVGFEVGRVEEGHFGLEGIQERARVFGGRAIIRSRPRHGTDIVVELRCRRLQPALMPDLARVPKGTVPFSRRSSLFPRQRLLRRENRDSPP